MPYQQVPLRTQRIIEHLENRWSSLPSPSTTTEPQHHIIARTTSCTQLFTWHLRQCPPYHSCEQRLWTRFQITGSLRAVPDSSRTCAHMWSAHKQYHMIGIT
jgi:hypothetical protein